MAQLPSVEDAVKLLKKTVKMSAIDNQKHIDLTLVCAQDRHLYQAALMTVQTAVIKKEYTQAQINEMIGIA